MRNITQLFINNKLPAICLFVWLITIMIGLLIDSEYYNQINLNKILQNPDLTNLTGYDELGRPVWARLAMGASTSFIIAISVVTLSAFFGVTIGLISGYFGSWIDLLITKIIDIFLAFPSLLLAIALAAVLGPGMNNLIIALAIVGWVSYARITRAQVLSIKHKLHVTAAYAIGTNHSKIMFKHILPLTLAPLGTEVTFAFAGVIIAEAGLSFLGLGVQAPFSSWGIMIKEGGRYLLTDPHLVFFPGLSLMMVVLTINFLGDKLRDHLDVRMDSK